MPFLSAESVCYLHTSSLSIGDAQPLWKSEEQSKAANLKGTGQNL